MSNIQVLKEDITISEINPSDLTTDCMFVYMMDGTIDVVRSQSMVKIFDEYHDNKKRVVKIDFTGGRLNPKTQTPRLE